MINKIMQLATAVLLILPTLVSAGIVQLPATGQTKCFDDAGGLIPCAGTGQDGEKQAGVAWPVLRFTDNGNGTITDNLTGLMWSKHGNAPNQALLNSPDNGCANTESDMTWQEALDFIQCLNTNNFAGFSDWRLPNINELESLVNADIPNTSDYLNGSGFGFDSGSGNTRVQSGEYWTSTSDLSDPASAWAIDLRMGDFPLSSIKTPVDPLNPGHDTRRMIPIRGESSGPAQLWQTGQKECFDSAGNIIIPCTNTGQDGEKQSGAVWPMSRFQTNVAATYALDMLTGLTWTTDSRTPGPLACAGTGLELTWQEALDYVKCLNQNAFLGMTDWRLPNRTELRSLVDYSQSNPALLPGNPFIGEEGNTFWSSTTDADRTKNAWTVSMFDGSLNGADKRNALLLVWPVSGSGNVNLVNHHIVDFNGGGKTDILWHHATTGAVSIWVMDGTTWHSTAFTGIVPDMSWKVVGTGDFNNDSKPDMLWYHATTGAVAIWLMNGTTWSSTAFVGVVSDLTWEIAGAGDFNSDGRADILWRNAATGAVAIWLMAGTSWSSTALVGVVSDLTWEIAGAGDFDEDGNHDILWRNNSIGSNAVWRMDGPFYAGGVALLVESDSNWKIVGTGDINGDGKRDILWRNGLTGDNRAWLMDGVLLINTTLLPAVSDTNWRIVGP